MNIDTTPKTNKEQLSVTYVCIRFIDIYRLSSSSLDSSTKTLFDKNHKTLKNSKDEIVGDDIISEISEEMETLISEERTNEDLKKDFSWEID